MSTKDRANIGVCPGCRFPIWADVELDSEVSNLRLSDGRPRAHVDAYVTAVKVAHECNGRRDSEAQKAAEVIADAFDEALPPT